MNMEDLITKEEILQNPERLDKLIAYMKEKKIYHVRLGDIELYMAKAAWEEAEV